MNATNPNTNQKPLKWTNIAIIVFCTAIITTIITALIIKYFFFPSPFKPIKLTAKEEQQLTTKLNQLSPGLGTLNSKEGNRQPKPLEPEKYSETQANREIKFTEREINALLAKNTNLADKLAIDLSDHLLSAKLLLDMEPDFPVIGGQTIRINAGMELAYAQEKPIAVLKGVSVMGVPIPNAWLGGLKNIDLIAEFGDQQGFWSAFAAGIEQLQISDGKLHIKLKE